MTETEPALPPVKYPSFNARAIAGAIDIFIVVTFAMPIGNWALDTLFGPIDTEALLALVKNPDILQDPHKFIPALWLEMKRQHLLLRSFLDNVIQIGLLAIYTLPFWFHYAATPGKMLLRMEIRDAKTGTKLSRGQAVLRFLSYVVSFLPFTLGFVWVIFDKKRRAWHDMLASTVVVFKPKKSTSSTI